MAISGYFFDAIKNSDGTYDRTYSSDDFSNYLDKLVGTGVFPNPSTNLQVQPNSGMVLIVKAGQCWINGHKMINSADLTITLDDSDVILNRIDRVIAYLDFTTRQMGIDVLKGTGASSPTAPALTRSQTRYELCLAEVYIAKQVEELTAADIKDTRGDSNLCGWVQGLIQQVDTTTLFDQWQAGFDDWFGTVKDTLSTSTLLRKFEYDYTTTSAGESTFDVSSFIGAYSYALDILEIRINGLTLTASEYTQENSVITLKTPIAEAGTVISFCIYKSVDGSDAQKLVDTVYQLEQELEDTRITSPTGGAKLNLTDSSADALSSFLTLGVGFHTILCGDKVQNLPKASWARLFGHLTDSSNGYLFAVCADGSIYSNFCAVGTWQGWKCIYDANPSLLWSGASFPSNGVTITPKKKLSQCRNGWILTFSQYSSGAAQDNLIQHFTIPKVAYSGSSWNGEKSTFVMGYSLDSSTGALLECAKVLRVYDDKLVSTEYNSISPANTMVLRSVQEF